ncbi:MAG: hypothetical protein ACNA8L_10365 [Luteolibacter sp.]
MNTLKNELASLLRHALTALAGIGSLLAARGCIAAEDEAAVNAAGLSVTEAVIVVAVAIVARILISLSGKLRLPGGPAALCMMMSAAALPLVMGITVAGSLASCADYTGPRFLIGVENDQGSVSYDSDAGGTVRVDSKVPAIRGAK